MDIAFLVLLQAADTSFNQPSYFLPVILGMFVVGAVVSLIAVVLGFARARAFGSSTRWFSFSALCLLLFHIQFLVFGFGAISHDNSITFAVLTFFNLFIVLAAICAIMGFVRLTNPR